MVMLDKLELTYKECALT